MCEINFMYAIDGKLTNTDILQINKMLTLGKQINNNGFGLFNEEGKIYKSPEMYRNSLFSRHILEKFNNSQFIVSHNRLATTGKTKKNNTHPFKVGRFIFCHNGILINHQELIRKYKITPESYTDSIVIGHVLNHHFKNTKDVLKSIQLMAEDITGTFSVFIYDTVEKRLYYIRNSAEFDFTLFTFKDKKIIVGSTNYKNHDKIYYERYYGFPREMYEDSYYKKTHDEIIYEISNKGIKKIGDFVATSYTYYYKKPKTIDKGLQWLASEIGYYYPAIMMKKVNKDIAKVKSAQFIVDYSNYFKNKKKRV